MRKKNVVILVDGEEDVLTLPCITGSPDNPLVLYGQPSQGLVVATATPSVKAETSETLGRMNREENDQS